MKKKFFIGILIVLFVTMLEFSGILPIVASFSARAMSPAISFVSRVGGSIKNTVGAFTRVGSLSSENNGLKQKVAELSGQLAELSEVKKENEVFTSQLGVKLTKDWTLLPAKVIVTTGSGFESSMILDKGERDGIKKGMVAVLYNNLIGRVTEVEEFTSTVLFLTNPNSSIVGQINDRNVSGVVRGQLGSEILGMEEIELGKKIMIGDLVSSSVISKEIPAGLAIGLVESIQSQDKAVFQKAKVRPILDYLTLRLVFVVLRTTK